MSDRSEVAEEQSPGRDASVVNDDKTLGGSDDKEPPLPVQTTTRERMPLSLEIFLVTLIASATLAVLQKGPLKTRRAPAPHPFFRSSSYVTDYYQGQLSAAFDHISETDVSFVMYYAPWDADCQAVRWEFEKVAQYFHTQVHFAAINCWNPDSECQQQFNRFQAYPVLVAYRLYGKGIVYNGVKEFSYMAHFLHHLLSPVVRIEQPAQLSSLRAKHDVVVSGFFDFENKNSAQGYGTFHAASINALERDSWRDVAFAVVTNRHAGLRLGLIANENSSHNIVHLHLWNETRIFPRSANFTADLLVRWVFNRLHEPLSWVNIPHKKSRRLSHYLVNHPTLVLFTPRNILHQSNLYHNMMKDIALHYYNCSTISTVELLIKSVDQEKRDAIKRQKQLESQCHDGYIPHLSSHNRYLKRLPTLANSTCCRTVAFHDTSAVEQCDLCATLTSDSTSGQHSQDLCETLGRAEAKEGLMQSVLHAFHLVTDACCELLHLYNPFARLLACCRSDSEEYVPRTFVGKSGPVIDDSVAAIKEGFKRMQCRRLFHANLNSEWLVPKFNGDIQSINGMDCRTNRSLQFVAIDSSMYSEFAARLGVQISAKKDLTAVVIIDRKQESAFAMEGQYTSLNIINFIQNFSSGNVSRATRTAEQQPSHHQEKRCSSSQNGTKVVCIQEVTSSSFKQIVLDETKDVVLFYYTRYCGFCSSYAYIYQTVAYIMSPLKNNLVFTRIDGDNNDLPWEYVAHKYPAIVFYPALRKSESQFFPPEVQLTVSNLLQFVASNLDSVQRMKLSLSLCNSPCILRMINETMQELRVLKRSQRILFARIRNARTAKETCQDCLPEKVDYLRDYRDTLQFVLCRDQSRLVHLGFLLLTLVSSQGQLSHTAQLAIMNSYARSEAVRTLLENQPKRDSVYILTKDRF